MSATTRIKQIRSEVAGPILFQGQTNVEWNQNFYVNQAQKTLVLGSLDGISDPLFTFIGNGSLNPNWSSIRFRNSLLTNEFQIRSNGSILQLSSTDIVNGGQFQIAGNGKVSIGINGSVLTNSALLNLSSPFTNGAHINFQPGTGYLNPVDGDLWYTGTALNFRYGGSTTINLLTGGGGGGIGTVTSVDITGNGIFDITGGPITNSGTISIDFQSQVAGRFFSSPALTSGVPTFRTIVNSDLPLSGVTSGTWNNVTVNSQGIVTSGSNVAYITATGLTTNFIPRWNGTNFANSSLFETGSLINLSSETKNIKIGSGLGLIEFDDFGNGSGAYIHGFSFYGKSIQFDDSSDFINIRAEQSGNPANNIEFIFSSSGTLVQANGTIASLYSGIQYAANYAANYINRSLVDKEYVDTNFLSSSGIVPVTLGGTGTGTQFTTGSIPFAGTSGIYQQNNSNFFWDNTNNRLGIGTNSPQRGIHSSSFRTETVSGSWIDVETYSIQTTDGNPQNLAVIPIAIGQSITFEARIQCVKTAGGGSGSINDSCSYIRVVKAKNVSGLVTLQTIQSTYTSEDAGLSSFNATFDASGSNIRVRVTGSINNIVTWNGTIIITK